MEQLVMRWVNDGSPAVMPQVPEGLGLTTLPEMKDGVEQARKELDTTLQAQ